MSSRQPLKLVCYTWHKFEVRGIWVKNTKTQFDGNYMASDELLEWLTENVHGRWAVSDKSYSISDVIVYIQDRQEAMMFKLAWGGR